MIFRAAPKQILTYYVLDRKTLKVVQKYMMDTNYQRFPAIKAFELMEKNGFTKQDYVLLTKVYDGNDVE